MDKVQELIYIWLREVGEVNYDRIKQACNYLNNKHALSFEKPIHNLFYPLLYSGVVEFSRHGKFCIAPECVISKGGEIHIVVNPRIVDNSLEANAIGIYTSNQPDVFATATRYQFNLESILTKIPSVDSCVLSYQQIHDVRLCDFEQREGVSRKKSDSRRWYFIDSTHDQCYSIPDQSINPDAINIATCYTRIITSLHNGIYNSVSRELKMNKYHMPILVYRVLMIESLFGGTMPYIDNEYYVFKNISRKAFSELNRIFCQSIKQDQQHG